jgi:hypothetical protein
MPLRGTTPAVQIVTRTAHQTTGAATVWDSSADSGGFQRLSAPVARFHLPEQLEVLAAHRFGDQAQAILSSAQSMAERIGSRPILAHALSADRVEALASEVVAATIRDRAVILSTTFLNEDSTHALLAGIDERLPTSAVRFDSASLSEGSNSLQALYARLLEAYPTVKISTKPSSNAFHKILNLISQLSKQGLVDADNPLTLFIENLPVANKDLYWFLEHMAQDPFTYSHVRFIASTPYLKPSYDVNEWLSYGSHFMPR